MFLQNRVELRKDDKWFIRAYSTHEDAGNSYDAYFTALRMQDSIASNQFYSNYYRTFWQMINRPQVRALPGAPANSLPMNEYQAVMDSLIATNLDFFTELHRSNHNSVLYAAGFGRGIYHHGRVRVFF